MAQRGRPPKNKPATPEQISDLNVITQEAFEESFDSFLKNMQDDNARQLYAQTLAKDISRIGSASNLLSSNGQYQPLFSEQLFQDLNINPQVASSVQIERWLLAPHKHSSSIRHLSQYLSTAVGQYDRSVFYLNTIKSYNYTLLPSDSDVEEKIDMKEYWHSYDICLRTLQKLNVKYQIPKIDYGVCTEGVGFYWISETSDDISFLQLPSDRCFITAPWSKGFLFAIDLTVFDSMRMTSQIPELYNAYKTFVDMRKALTDGEKLAPYQYYSVPPDKGWVFTFNPTYPNSLPPLTSSMSPALDTLSYRELIKSKLALDLFKVIALKIPMNKDGNNMALTYPVAKDIKDAVQSSLPENIKVYTSPFESVPINTDQTKRYDEIVTLGSDTFFSSVGFQKTQFGGGEAKQGSILQVASGVDFAYASYHLYRQYENCINWILASKTKKYKFQITMFGNSLNKEKEIETAAGIVRSNNTGFLNLFATLGYEPFQVKSTILLEKQLDFVNLLQPLSSGFNSKQGGDGGAPTKLDSDKTDSGIQSSDNQSNENRT
jgi:hypothetical protein